MGGTILCGVTDSSDGRAAAQLAVALGERLGLRLVLAHVVEVPAGSEKSLTARKGQAGAERALEALAREIGFPSGTDSRVVMGDRADRLAWIAAEEGADLIVLGSRASGFRGRRLGCTLARELEAVTLTPVVVAPPQTRKRSQRRLALADDAAGR
jgi:nucleotide-binding universal stress UspA family protein